MWVIDSQEACKLPHALLQEAVRYLPQDHNYRFFVCFSFLKLSVTDSVKFAHHGLLY